ncbi:MAG: hypothetical protein IJZ59_06335 [Alphaproteobacteria bacterium]|nr:hypothetical protein [Alphaproteobacteria bacterium]
MPHYLIILLFVGIGSVFIPKNRMVYWWTSVTFFALIYSALSLMGYFGSSALTFDWQAIPNIPIAISFVPEYFGCCACLGVLILSFFAVYYNIIVKKEERPNTINGLVLLNCVFVISALLSPNYIQLLAAVGMSDVIVFSSINQLDAKKQYIYGNFFADFILLNTFALIFVQSDSIVISSFGNASKQWGHRDFIAIMLLLSIFIKSGLVMFHTAYQKMSSLNYNRLNFILYLTTPLMGAVVFENIKDIFVISDYSYPLLKIFSVLTVLSAFIGTLCVDNIKRKAVYLSMMFWGLIFMGYAWQISTFSPKFYILLLSAFLFNNSLMLIYKSASDEVLISRMGGFLQSLKFTFFINVISVILYVVTWWIYAQKSIPYAMVGLFVISITSAHVFSEVYLSQSKADEWVLARLKNPLFLLWLPIVFIFSVVLYIKSNDWQYIYGFAVFWMLLFIFHPLRKLSVLYQYDSLQKLDKVTWIYNFFILAPLRFFGRVLRLIVDFVFIERTLIASIKNAIRFAIFIFRKLHGNNIWGHLIFVLLGVVIVAIAYYKGVMQ